MKLRFTIRDLLLLTVVVAILLAWMIDRRLMLFRNHGLDGEVHSLSQQIDEDNRNLDHLAKMLHELRENKRAGSN